jgi:hypothetical protein
VSPLSVEEASLTERIEREKVKAATWVDSQTGLEWQYESPGRMSWHDAQIYGRELSLNDKDDWRIPAVRELESLLDRHKYRPVMREVVPFQDTLGYWSSTTFGPHKNNAWIVMFDGAYVLSYYKTNKYYIRCVRG